MNGYCGKILIVNLTRQTWEVQHLCDDSYRRFLSGVGLAANPDAVLVAKLTGVKAGPVARSMPPIYNHTLTLR